MCNWNTCNNKNCFIGDTMSELQEMAREILEVIEYEDFKYDYRCGGYKKSTVAKLIQKVVK